MLERLTQEEIIAGICERHGYDKEGLFEQLKDNPGALFTCQAEVREQLTVKNTTYVALARRLADSLGEEDATSVFTRWQFNTGSRLAEAALLDFNHMFLTPNYSSIAGDAAKSSFLVPWIRQWEEGNACMDVPNKIAGAVRTILNHIRNYLGYAVVSMEIGHVPPYYSHRTWQSDVEELFYKHVVGATNGKLTDETYVRALCFVYHLGYVFGVPVARSQSPNTFKHFMGSFGYIPSENRFVGERELRSKYIRTLFKESCDNVIQYVQKQLVDNRYSADSMRGRNYIANFFNSTSYDELCTWVLKEDVEGLSLAIGRDDIKVEGGSIKVWPVATDEQNGRALGYCGYWVPAPIVRKMSSDWFFERPEDMYNFPSIWVDDPLSFDSEELIHVEDYGYYADSSVPPFDIDSYDFTISSYYRVPEDEEEDEDYYPIRSYDANPLHYCSGKFLHSEKHPPTFNDNILYMGVELEVEVHSGSRSSLAESSIELLGDNHVITKNDGSLDDGFEIVTTPLTLGYHKKIWSPFLTSDLRTDLRSYNTGTCGMHVHLSRNCFTRLTLGKLIDFFNRPYNREFMRKVAQRRSESWARYDEGKKVTFVRDVGHIIHDKYVAVNISHPNTVEIRVFRGTLDEAAFFKNLEFCEAIVEYVQVASIRELQWDYFMRFLHASGKFKKRYKNFLEYMELREHGIAQAEWSISTHEQPNRGVPEQPDITENSWTLSENPRSGIDPTQILVGVYVTQFENYRVLLRDGSIVEVDKDVFTILNNASEYPLEYDIDSLDVMRYGRRRSLNYTVLDGLNNGLHRYYDTHLFNHLPHQLEEFYSNSTLPNLINDNGDILFSRENVNRDRWIARQQRATVRSTEVTQAGRVPIHVSSNSVWGVEDPARYSIAQLDEFFTLIDTIEDYTSS